ncbi:MAG: YhjD/YihY/BrkB family envelope integrity protein [bacterium]
MEPNGGSLKRLWGLVGRELWGLGPARTPGWAAPLLNGVRAVLLTASQFRANRLSIHASGLSFFMLLSLVPMLAFLFLILKVFEVAAAVVKPSLLEEVAALVKPFLLQMVAGGNTQLVARISEYIEGTRGLELGGYGLLTVFLIGYLVLQRVKTTLNIVWRVAHRPSYRYRVIEYALVLVVTPGLLGITFGLSTILRGLYESQGLSEWVVLNELSLRLAAMLEYLVLWLTAFFAFAFLPDTKVRWPSALVGAVVGGTGLAIAQNVYILVIFQVSNYSLVYGALALLPFLMIWFYLAWTIFLFSAQLSCVVQNFTMFLEQRRHVGRRLGSTTPYLGLLALTGAMRLMRQTGEAPRLKAIAKATGLPAGVVEDALKRLVQAGLLTPVADEADRFVPREVLEPLTLREVIERLEAMPGFRQPPPAWEQAGGSALRAVFRQANEALAVPLGGYTLGQMVERDLRPVDGPPGEEPRPAPKRAPRGRGSYRGGGEGAPPGSGKRALLRKK